MPVKIVKNRRFKKFYRIGCGLFLGNSIFSFLYGQHPDAAPQIYKYRNMLKEGNVKRYEQFALFGIISVPVGLMSLYWGLHTKSIAFRYLNMFTSNFCFILSTAYFLILGYGLSQENKKNSRRR